MIKFLVHSNFKNKDLLGTRFLVLWFREEIAQVWNRISTFF